MQNDPTPTPEERDTWDDEEDTDRDLKEFAFFSKLEANGGKPPKGFYMGGCFFILPFVIFLSIAFFFLLNYLY